MIDVTGIDLVEFVKKVYELSKPKGMGHMHFQAGPLDQTMAERIVELSKDDGTFALCTDYVEGRACKMNVWRHDRSNPPKNGLFIHATWYDHTDAQFAELLSAMGLAKIESEIEHSHCCECSNCQDKQKQN